MYVDFFAKKLFDMYSILIFWAIQFSHIIKGITLVIFCGI